jgi:type II secretory pathway component PulJ
MTAVLCRDWRELSEAASQEKDPKKLMELIEELNKVLDQRERDLHKHRPRNQDGNDSSVARPAQHFISL